MTDQTTDPCPTPETHNWGCGCPSDVAAAIASCPGRELSPSPCRCPCYGCKHNCGAHNPETVPPVVQSPIREQLLNAIDFSFCQSLGFGTPEGLLAAYEASRTHTVDQTALRDRIAALFRHKPDEERLGDATPGEIADAVLAAVLPATTNHDTDTGASKRGAKAEALLLRFTAEAHRRKWDYDRGLDDDGAPIKSEAFDALHRLGEEMRVELEELRRVADETAATGADR